MMSEFPEFNNEASYLEYLAAQTPLPSGFRVSTTSIAFTPSERPTLEPYRMDLGLIVLDQPTEVFAGVFTRNAFPGAPVILGRQRLNEPNIQGVLVNNKIANVRAVTGIEDANRLTDALAREMKGLGFPFDEPLRPLMTLTGAAIPFLRISEEGLIDIKTGRLLDLFVRKSG